MIYRHPFPGPGLGVRILGEVNKEYADILRRADAHLYRGTAARPDLYDEVSQAFAVFLPVKSVGVVGDARRYEYVITLRAVKTIDFMTAQLRAPAVRIPGAGLQPHHQRGRTVSPAWPTTSPASRRPRSSGNDSTSGTGWHLQAPDNI